MAEKLKIIPLGGLNEIGKNMTAYEYGGEIIVVDCGMAFPGDDMYGIDCVIPDVSYLIKNKSRIRGLFITHGHEDHIGAIPYVLKQINMPIYCTRFTAGLIKLKLEEHQLVKSTKLITVEAGKSVRAGKFTVEFIHVNHSIADSVAFAIHTKMGTIVHTGDFKIDSTPIDGEVIDLARLGELGKEGVLCLCADSTNVERPGFTPSEKVVGATFMRQFQNCDERIIVTTFASNVHRIQQVLDAAAQCGRKVAVLDADITGPSIPKVFGVHSRAMAQGDAIVPVETSTGIQLMSVNLLLDNETDPVVWRGPVIGGVVQQFWGDVLWNDVDYMFVDMPPGTGDVALNVFQTLPVDGVIIVTSPQDLVSMVVEKAVKMAKMMNIPVVGLVENMSYLTCPDCGKKIYLFGEGKTQEAADRYGLPLLAKMPIDPALAKLADAGRIEDFEGDWLDGAAARL